mmetsp:Transcript_35643/g.115565  ORF Transcript_35643/g.115565 Transcript_35643/m.115565 type:complete len:93 (+) Transcript_35643:118-396(+)
MTRPCRWQRGMLHIINFVITLRCAVSDHAVLDQLPSWGALSSGMTRPCMWQRGMLPIINLFIMLPCAVPDLAVLDHLPFSAWLRWKDTATNQ